MDNFRFSFSFIVVQLWQQVDVIAPRKDAYKKNKKQILDYIKLFIKEKGYSPSIPEIGSKFQLANSTIHEHIENLQEKNYLYKKNYQTRAIEISEQKKLSRRDSFRNYYRRTTAHVI